MTLRDPRSQARDLLDSSLFWKLCLNPTHSPSPLLSLRRSYRQSQRNSLVHWQGLRRCRRFREEAPAIAEIFYEGPRATDNRHLAIAGRSLPVLFNRPFVAAGSVRTREIPA